MEPGDLTLELVKPLVGTKFEVALPDGGTTTLTLDDALPYEIPQRRRSRGVTEPKRQPFSVYFLGPPSPILPQSMYTFRSENVTLETVFIVPVGADEQAAEYEAIFT